MHSDDERVEAHLERHRRRLEEHEAALAATRDQLAGSDDRYDGTVHTITGAGLLAALGPGTGAGTVAAQSDPQGQSIRRTDPSNPSTPRRFPGQ